MGWGLRVGMDVVRVRLSGFGGVSAGHVAFVLIPADPAHDLGERVAGADHYEKNRLVSASCFQKKNGGRTNSTGRVC